MTESFIIFIVGTVCASHLGHSSYFFAYFPRSSIYLFKNTNFMFEITKTTLEIFVEGLVHMDLEIQSLLLVF
jgi:hypothetical protein